MKRNVWDDAYALWLKSGDPGALQMPRGKARRSEPRLDPRLDPALGRRLDVVVPVLSSARLEDGELDEALQMPREILF